MPGHVVEAGISPFEMQPLFFCRPVEREGPCASHSSDVDVSPSRILPRTGRKIPQSHARWRAVVDTHGDAALSVPIELILQVSRAVWSREGLGRPFGATRYSGTSPQ